MLASFTDWSSSSKALSSRVQSTVIMDIMDIIDTGTQRLTFRLCWVLRHSVSHLTRLYEDIAFTFSHFQLFALLLLLLDIFDDFQFSGSIRWLIAQQRPFSSSTRYRPFSNELDGTGESEPADWSRPAIDLSQLVRYEEASTLKLKQKKKKESRLTRLEITKTITTPRTSPVFWSWNLKQIHSIRR